MVDYRKRKPGGKNWVLARRQKLARHGINRKTVAKHFVAHDPALRAPAGKCCVGATGRQAPHGTAIMRNLFE
jgi:hypothetical protein